MDEFLTCIMEYACECFILLPFIISFSVKLKDLNIAGDKHHMNFDIFRPLKNRIKTVKITPEFVSNLSNWDLDHVHVVYNQHYIPGFLDKIEFRTKKITIDTIATVTANLLSNMNLAMFNDK